MSRCQGCRYFATKSEYDHYTEQLRESEKTAGLPEMSLGFCYYNPPEFVTEYVEVPKHPNSTATKRVPVCQASNPLVHYRHFCSRFEQDEHKVREDHSALFTTALKDNGFRCSFDLESRPDFGVAGRIVVLDAPDEYKGGAASGIYSLLEQFFDADHIDVSIEDETCQHSETSKQP